MFSLKYSIVSHTCLRVSIFFIINLPQIWYIKEWIALDPGGRVVTYKCQCPRKESRLTYYSCRICNCDPFLRLSCVKTT
jgi:hypothetical protein